MEDRLQEQNKNSDKANQEALSREKVIHMKTEYVHPMLYRACQKKVPHEETQLLKMFPTTFVSKIYFIRVELLVCHQMQFIPSSLNTQFLRYGPFTDMSVNCSVTIIMLLASLHGDH